jgi:tetratricopeptide (TPR) repeat protein
VFEANLKALFFTAIVCLLAAAGTPGLEGRAYALSENVKAQVSRAVDRQDFNKAVDLLEQAYSQDAYDDELKQLLAMAHTSRGWARVAANDFESALDDFRKAKLVEPEKQATTYLGLGYTSFRLKEYDDALYYLFEVVYIDPRQGQAHEMIGQIYYQRGKLQEAITEWELAQEILPDDQGLKSLLARARKEQGVEGEFTKRGTYYFNIKYEGEEKRQLGDEVLDILNSAYSSVNGDLNYYPKEPVNVILYTKKQFTDLTDAPSWSGGVFDGNIRIPIGGSHINKEALAAVLHHEYTHAVVHMIVGHGLPTWLDEGVAQYEEHWARQAKADIRLDGVLPLSSLSGSFMGMDPARAEQAYAESLSAVNFYVDRFGMYSLAKLLRLMGEGKSLSGAMEESAGVRLEQFELLWKDSVPGG